MKNIVLKILFLIPECFFGSLGYFCIGISFCFLGSELFGLSMDPSSGFYSQVFASRDPMFMANFFMFFAVLFSVASCCVRRLVNKYSSKFVV